MLHRYREDVAAELRLLHFDIYYLKQDYFA